MTDAQNDFDWFARGEAVMTGNIERTESYFPPLHDIEAQRQWLCGFGAAWATSPGDAEPETYRLGDALAIEPVGVALVIALKGRMPLLKQLQSHGMGNQTRH
jgi:hypothetical protein